MHFELKTKYINFEIATSFVLCKPTLKTVVKKVNASEVVSSRMDIIFEDNNLNSPSSLLQQRDGSTNSPIKDYLKDKTIFLTGGFGFIGKLMVEKLLQCEVKRIYLFVRAKKGKSIEERFETLTSEPVSDLNRKVLEKKSV